MQSGQVIPWGAGAAFPAWKGRRRKMRKAVLDIWRMERAQHVKYGWGWTCVPEDSVDTVTTGSPGD